VFKTQEVGLLSFKRSEAILQVPDRKNFGDNLINVILNNLKTVPSASKISQRAV
jgi:hypothetical protein